MRSNSTPPSKPRSRRSPASNGFTYRQTVLLVLLGLLGLVVIGITASFLLATNPAGPAAAAVEQASATTGATEAQSASVEPPSHSTIVIPADCAKNGTDIQEGQARVIDGQTLEVTMNEATIKVVFAGIKFLPESGPSTSFLESKITGKPVILVKDATDQDAEGRQARYVFAGGQFINEALVRQGYARADYNTADRACIIPFQLAEQQARIDRLGIWQSTPVPTATFLPLVTVDNSQQPCDCSRKYTCSDFQTHAAAQACFNTCNDYSSKLDEDHNGIACEGLP